MNRLVPARFEFDEREQQRLLAIGEPFCLGNQVTVLSDERVEADAKALGLGDL